MSAKFRVGQKVKVALNNATYKKEVYDHLVGKTGTVVDIERVAHQNFVMVDVEGEVHDFYESELEISLSA